MPSRLLSLSLAAALAGCAAGVTEGTSRDDLQSSASLCTPLAYDTSPAADTYGFFPTDADAAAFMKRLDARGILATVSGPGSSFVEITADERLKRLVAEVFVGLKKVFPRQLEGLDAPPPIAIVRTGIVNAFALGPGALDDDKMPWLFIVHTAVQRIHASDTALRGLFAHELSHLVLRNGLEGFAKHRVIYAVDPAHEDGRFGETAEGDPSVGPHVESILALQSRIGGPSELGIPLLLRGSYWNALLADLPPSADCAAVTAKRTELRAAQLRFLPRLRDGGDGTPASRTAEEQAELDRLSSEMSAELAICVGSSGDVTSLMELTRRTARLPPTAVEPDDPDHAKLVARMLPAELRVDAEMPAATLATRLLRIEPELRHELVALRTDPAFPIERLRVYDREEDSDDAAVRVLAAIGDDPTGMAQFLATALLEAPAKEACLADVGAGRPVPYGALFDVHPATCWRYRHILDLAKALAPCIR